MTATKLSKLDDKKIVALFVEHLARSRHPGLEVERKPDEEAPGVPDIDALAGEFAIEHTSIDSVPEQRRDTAWFMEAVGSLEQKLQGRLSFRLLLALPYQGIQRGQDWSKIKVALHNWVLNESSGLSEGSHIISDVPQIPFEFRATRMRSGRPGLLLSRSVPEDPTFTSRLRDQLDPKIEKLAPYKNRGKTTILLVESPDVLMDEAIMWDNLKEAYPEGLPPGVDHVWFVHTSIPEDIRFFEMNTAFER